MSNNIEKIMIWYVAETKNTLINAEKLTTYPGAVADENYDRQKDGGKKWQSLVKDLQNN